MEALERRNEGFSQYGAGDKKHKMGPLVTFINTVLVPAVIAGGLYILLSFVIVPLYQRYKGRYSRYIPVDSISATGLTIRDRISSAVGRFVLPSRWRERFNAEHTVVTASVRQSSADVDDESGEELFEFDARRREALSLDASRRGDTNSNSRLSVDLEQGFASDSDDEDDRGRVGNTGAR